MALADDLVDAQLSHQIGLYRLATGVVRRTIALMDRVEADLVAQIEALGPPDDGSAWRTDRLNELLAALRALNAEAYAAVRQQLTDETQALALYEGEYQLDLLRATVPVRLDWNRPARAQLIAAALSRPFQGGLLREWVTGMEAGRATRLREATRIGYAEGETTSQIVRRVRGTRALNYKDGVLEISRRSAATIVRTAVNHTANAAREQVYGVNRTLIKGVEWISTLDLRTTPICRARDGKVFPVDSGPRPPAHLGCRSTTAPVVKSWRELGISLDDVPPPARASMNGQVSGELTYGAWLKRQSRAVQDEVLGPTKARLFRDGGLTMEKFVEMRTGHEYTLDELRAREGAAFRRAGLEAA